ncbi:MAG TPA: hypothetical protein VM432_01630 [Bdellovibrionales bacterium]|jgi:hypothetical protein|nr:hypothetical protein [Bdellovibrionales bacterium]
MSRFSLFLAALIFSVSAQAEIRPIFIPGKLATLIWQGVSAMGGIDPEPREFFDALAIPEQEQSGGKAKGLKTEAKDFVLACGTKGMTKENVICSVNFKPSDRTKIDYKKQTAEIEVTGPEAALLYAQCAGNDATEPFVFETQNGWIQIESTADRFYFRFAK